jgi:hypothetical protein
MKILNPWSWPIKTSRSPHASGSLEFQDFYEHQKRVKAVLSLFCAASFVLGNSIQAQDSLTNGLVAYLPFTGGDTHDMSGRGNDCRIIGGVTRATDRFGNADNCFQFDGTTGYMKGFADAFPSTTKTISLWLFAETYANRPVLLAYGKDCGHSLMFGLNLVGGNDYSLNYHCGPTTSAPFQPTFATNSWKNLIVSVSDTNISFYLDGREVYSEHRPPVAIHVADSQFSIGVATSVFGIPPFTNFAVGYFQGRLDDIRIYDRALSKLEVRNLYAQETHYKSTLAIKVKIVQVDLFVVPGNTYQLESSFDLVHWSSVGNVETATSEIISKDFSVEDTGQFFRFSETTPQ